MTAHADILVFPEEEEGETPLFPVQAPDGIRTLAETPRQTRFFGVLAIWAPTILVYPIPNAGKRNPAKARREGIMAGIFDTEAQWDPGAAHVEFKGYNSRGRAGKLSPAQIRWGNRMHRLGKPVACFFDPFAAARWLHGLGAPFEKGAPFL